MESFQLVSVGFLLFVAVSCAAYFAMPKKYRWAVLLAASYLFYWMNSGRLVLVLLAMTAATWLTGIWLGRKNDSAAAYLRERREELTAQERKAYKLSVTKVKRRILILGILLDFATLLFFKYYNFLLGNVSPLLSLFGLDAKDYELDLLLPIGLSFYTLQAISYMVDVYRGKYAADKNFPRFALYMSFFPQIIQGPIARHDKMADQLMEGHPFDFSRLKYGSQLILWGFMKKLILADRIGIFVSAIFDHSKNYGGMILLVGAIAYSIQIYADFSAGMDIATGVAQIFGIELAMNFNQPYFSRSIEEFWRRWHITLGEWMRDYIFYPLSLSKLFGNLGKGARKIFGKYIGKKLPAFLAMFVVYILVGFWHGSSWKYIAYGLWNGVIITTGILLEPVYEKGLAVFHVKSESFSWKLFQMVRTFLLCCFGRFFPRAASCMTAFAMIRTVFASPESWQLVDGTLMNLGLDKMDFAAVALMVVVLLLVDIAHEHGAHIREWIASQGFIFRWLVYWGAFYAVVIFGVYGPLYDSSAFIYQQF